MLGPMTQFRGPHADQTQAFGLQEILQYKQPAVRDLAWTLLSPPLLMPRNTGARWHNLAWGQRAYGSYEERLRQLERDPTGLLESLAARRDHRLGSYFEGLLSFWLADPANPLYRLMANGLAVRAGQQTLGELDFVVKDLASGAFQHWEVAVKFYLGIRAGGDYSAWVGPGLRDRLDLKVTHLVERQLPLTEHPAARASLLALGIEQCSNTCLLKGRLFYPHGVDPGPWQPKAAEPLHWQGWWLPAADFLAQYEAAGLQWCLLPKDHWLTPLTPGVRIGDVQEASRLLESALPDFDNRAIAVVGLRDGWEVERGFITPPGWPGALAGIQAS